MSKQQTSTYTNVTELFNNLNPVGKGMMFDKVMDYYSGVKRAKDPGKVHRAKMARAALEYSHSSYLNIPAKPTAKKIIKKASI